MQLKWCKSKCVHISASSTRPGDHISLSQLIDRLMAVQFVLQDPGANSDSTLAARTLLHKQTENTRTQKKKGRITIGSVLTTKLLLTFSKMRFSFSAIASPFRFLTRFFSSFLQAYILPVARTWQAQTWKTSKQGNAMTWTNSLWSATNGSCNASGRRFLHSSVTLVGI